MIFHVSDVRKRVERLCSGQFIMNFIKRCSCYATDLTQTTIGGVTHTAFGAQR